MKTNNINYLYAKQRFEVTIIDLITLNVLVMDIDYGSYYWNNS